MTARLIRLAAVSLLALPAISHAAGLGPGKLHSALGEPLDVTIDIVSRPEERIEDRCFRLVAPPRAESGEASRLLATFQVETQAGQRRLRIRSRDAVGDPILNLFLRMDCGADVVRRYTFLPDFRPLPAVELPNTSAETSRQVPPPAADATAEASEPTAAGSSDRPTANTAQNRARPPRPAAEAESAPPRPKKTPRPRPPSPPKPPKATSGLSDRLSIGGMDTALPLVEPEPVLRLSWALGESGLIYAAHTERPEAVRSLMQVERQLIERAQDLSFAQYDPATRLAELEQLLAEVKNLSVVLRDGVTLPVSQRTAPASTEGPAKKEQPAPAKDDTWDVTTGLGIIGLLLAVFGGVWWFRQRRTRDDPSVDAPWSAPDKPRRSSATSTIFRTPEAEIESNPSEQDGPESLDGPSLPKGVEPRLSDYVTQISVSHTVDSSTDDELTLRLETAEVMMCFNRFQAAAAEIEEYLEEHPDAGLRGPLALLSIYRRGNQREAFESLAEKLRKAFNIAPLHWREGAEDSGPTPNHHQLEDFPHIISRLKETWRTEAGLNYVRYLMTDNRDGSRSGFSLDVAEELSLLEAMLMSRLGIREDRAGRSTGQDIHSMNFVDDLAAGGEGKPLGIDDTPPTKPAALTNEKQASTESTGDALDVSSNIRLNDQPSVNLDRLSPDSDEKDKDKDLPPLDFPEFKL